jgi:RND superfamily putative drug exporter
VEKLSGWVIRHRLVVGLSWLVITVVGMLVAPSLSGRLQPGTHVTGPGYTANVQIARSYGGATQDPAVVVLDLPTGQTVNSPQAQAKLRAVDRGIATAAPSLRLVSYASTGSRTLVGNGGTSTIVLAYPPKPGDDMATDQVDALTRAATAAAPGLTVHGTSLRALEAGNTTGGGNSSVTGELIIGAIGALVAGKSTSFRA